MVVRNGQLRRRVRKHARHVTDSARSHAESMRSELKDFGIAAVHAAAEELCNRAEAYLIGGQGKVAGIERMLFDKARKNPGKTLAIAAGAALLLTVFARKSTS